MKAVKCKWVAALLCWVMAVGLAMPGEVICNEAPWVVDAGVPGTDLPVRGRSLFDYLCRNTGVATQDQKVPFPFTALLSRLRERLKNTGSAPPYAAVLIPLGRSLQRHTAAPNFFNSPRVVVAVLGESADASAPLLKDRLYIGYQELAGVLEIISYNEAMGRFEFQLVKDYKPGGTPRVYYAKRAICVACHQNQAPLFSRPLWRETNANPAVATRLLAAQHDFYGLPISVSIDVPNAIDDAIQRANRYSFDQLLWTEGCAAHQNAIACRMELSSAALQLRLSGGRGYAKSDALEVIHADWQRRWPQGMNLPDANIPNRDPLAEGGAAKTAREVVVPAVLDPLLPRPSLGVARFENGSDQEAVIAGLADFFAAADIKQLDADLYQRGQTAARRSYRANCRFARNAVSAASRLAVQCKGATDASFAVEGRLYFNGTRLQRGVFDRIAVQEDILDDVSVADAASVAVGATGLTLSLRRGELHARRRNGNALTNLHLQWQAGAWRAQKFTGSLTIDERDDFEPLRNALQRLNERTVAGKSAVFAAQPLRRTSLVPALFAELKIAAAPSCCLDDTGLPSPRLEHNNTLDMTMTAGLVPQRAAALQNLQRYCAPCHDSAERFPPNFLSGDLAAVQSKLTHCAARIDYRLSMWELPPAQRAKTPMPPELALRADQRDPLQWRNDPAYLQLRQYISSLRKAPPAGTAQAYQQLDTCLPEGG